MGGQHAWQHAMLWLSAPLLAMVAVPLFLREPRREEVGEGGASLRERLTEFWRYRGTVLPILAGFVVVEMADSAALIWASPIFARSFDLSAGKVGSLMGIVLLCSGLIGMFAGGILADICQRRAGAARRSAFMMGLLALLSVPAGCFALAPTPLLASCLLAVLIVAGSMISMMSSALLIVVIPNELRGLCMGAALFGNTAFCIALAPLLVSLISGALGGSSALAMALSAVCASTGLLSAGIFLKGGLSARGSARSFVV
jgi:MFS family permease